MSGSFNVVTGGLTLLKYAFPFLRLNVVPPGFPAPPKVAAL